VITATGQRKKSTINYQKAKYKAEKRMVEMWRRPPAYDNNAATATAPATAMAMVMAAAATKATAEGNGCNEGNGVVDDGGEGKGKGSGDGNGCDEDSGVGTALRAMWWRLHIIIWSSHNTSSVHWHHFCDCHKTNHI
jgi:hypothetical protein